MPYAVKASLGTQDLAVPNVIDMQDVDADVGMTDDGTTSHVIGLRPAVYDSSVGRPAPGPAPCTSAIHGRLRYPDDEQRPS